MTVQATDFIFYDKAKYALVTYPLDSYWRKSLKRSPFGEVLTGCRRGYIATWAIAEGGLYLSGLISPPEYDRELRLELFPGLLRVQASWYSGQLVLGVGKGYSDGYRLRFEGYLGFDVVDGEVTAGPIKLLGDH